MFKTHPAHFAAPSLNSQIYSTPSPNETSTLSESSTRICSTIKRRIDAVSEKIGDQLLLQNRLAHLSRSAQHRNGGKISHKPGAQQIKNPAFRFGKAPPFIALPPRIQETQKAGYFPLDSVIPKELSGHHALPFANHLHSRQFRCRSRRSFRSPSRTHYM